MASSVVSSFGYGKAIGDLFIGLANGAVSDGAHGANLTGNWVINLAKFDDNQYYVVAGMITGFDTRTANQVWTNWAGTNPVYNVEFVTPVMYCPIITNSMVSMGNLQIQYRQQVLDYILAQA